MRRNTEASLLVLASVVAVGGYWLTSLAKSSGVPHRLALYAGTYIGVYLVCHLAVRRFTPAADPLFLPIAALLNAVGLVLIARLDVARHQDLAGAQLRWLVISGAAFVATLVFVKDVRALARYRYSWAAAAIVLILLPITPHLGETINGARLWVRVGSLTFQPGEFGKICLVLFFAGYLAERRELLAVAVRRIGPLGVPELRHFGPVMVAWAVSVVVLVQERELGASLLFFAIFVVMLWVATARPIYPLSGLVLFFAGSLVSYHLFGYVRARIEVWLHPFATIHTSGYQVVQSLFALATGGVWGTGLGLGRPDLIPEVATDFIFSAVGEELGLVGTTALLCAYAIFGARAFGLATRCRDDFSKLLVTGLATVFTLQTILIVGGVTRLIPLTGVTLPFMSYGGSSLLANFIVVALLLRVSHDVVADEATSPAGWTPGGYGEPLVEVGPAGGGR
ncbi:MAG TPA: FtsW/RodA/SpoVE family cell cycle protein [Actinomycetota bacterium]|nr:FtsW/RodA/SpoVE family cell cycle protein [Actinomycetota bacterium]